MTAFSAAGDDGTASGSGRDDGTASGSGRDDGTAGGSGRGTGAAGQGSAGENGERLASQAELLNEMKVLRRRARSARHAYWFPLLLFGVLAAGSLPLYTQPAIQRTGPGAVPGYASQRWLPGLSGIGGFTQAWLGYYWVVALVAGLLATQLFYRWHARRVGLQTPSRGYLVTTAIAAAAVIVIPFAIRLSFLGWLGLLISGDLIIRGTFPLVIIGLGLLALAWIERSRALTAIAVVYTSAALLAALYDLSNFTWRMGWNLPVSDAALPSVLLCAAVLLICGAGAGIAALLYRRRSLT